MRVEKVVKGFDWDEEGVILRTSPTSYLDLSGYGCSSHKDELS
jgi:hypothetical protein